MTQKTFFVKLLSLLAFAIPVYSQIGYNENSNTLLCSKPGGVYCVHGSLAGSTTISCAGPTTAEIRSCSIELSGILSKKLARLAVCYESSPTAGDAVCAVNGTGFTLSHRTTIAVPETILCNTSSSKDDASPQGILHQKINSKFQTPPRFTLIPLSPPVTLDYVPVRETAHAETVIPCSDPRERMPGGARASHGLYSIYHASSVTVPVPAGSTGFIGYDNAQTGPGGPRFGVSASAAERVPGDIPGLVSGDNLGDSGQARSTGSGLFSGGSLQKQEPIGWFALLAVTIMLGCTGSVW